MAAILVSLLIIITIYLVITDRFFIGKNPRNRNYSNQNIPKYKPQKQYEIKSKSVTYLPSQPKQEEYTITPKIEEIPKKEDFIIVPSNLEEILQKKRQRGYSRPEMELRGLVKDNQAVDRLILALMDRHPQRNREWCADKALGDWLRDRQ